MTTRTNQLIAALAVGAALAVPRVAAAQARTMGSDALWRGRAAVAEREGEQARENADVSAGHRAGIDKGVDWLQLGFKFADSARDFGESFTPLDADDARFDPDYSPPGMPDVPISCGEDAECQQCYEKAQHDLNFVRVQLEKLRAIYDSTTTMAKNAMAFGDDVSSIHGMMGLAWQTQKRGIQASVTHMGQTYDGKLRELLATLESQLKKMDECEKQYFNSPDWYNRFGFIYYQFMEARYTRH